MRDDETGSPSNSNSGATVTPKPRSSPSARSTSTSPARLVAEPEVLPDDDLGGPELADQHLVGELLPACARPSRA